MDNINLMEKIVSLCKRRAAHLFHLTKFVVGEPRLFESK